MDTSTATDHATTIVLTEAIAERLRWRNWYRAHPWTLDWPSRWANEVQLRELVRVGRLARRVSREAADRHDPVTAAKAAEDLALGDHFAYPETVA